MLFAEAVGAVAVRELDPLTLAFVLELDDLDVLWVLLALEDLDEVDIVSLRPLAACASFCCWLAVHIPVTLWAITAISGLDVAVLVLDNLVLVLSDCVPGVEDRIVNGLWIPVAVVGSPLGLINLFLGWHWLRSISWVWGHIVRVVGLAGGNDGVAEVVLQWDVVGAETM